jgi:hypothetical protein
MSVWRGDARVAVEAKEDAGITGEAWLVRGTTGNDQVGEVKDWSKFFEGVPEDEVSAPARFIAPKSDVEPDNKRRIYSIL